MGVSLILCEMCSFLFKFSVQWLNWFIALIDLDCDKKKICKDTRGVTRRRKSMTYRQHNGKEKGDTQTDNDSQNTTQITKDCTTRTL